MSPHKFRKWLNDYAIEVGGELELKNSGGEYSFRVKKEKELTRTRTTREQCLIRMTNEDIMQE